MREDILSRLSRINEEEKRILDGENKVNKRLYTAFAREFIVNSHRLMQDGEQIALRRHTRFADFPAHGHNYVEMTYVCSGEVTHVIKHREVKMRAGDALLLNRHAQHSVRKTGEGDISINVMLATECFHSLASALPISSPLSSFMAENIRSNGEGEYMLFSTEGVPPLENLFENLCYAMVGNDVNYAQSKTRNAPQDSSAYQRRAESVNLSAAATGCKLSLLRGRRRCFLP